MAQQHEVVLHYYDLSQGMAAQLSVQLVGKYFEGIWHTGIIVYGKEFYFGGGICRDPIGMTPYGQPLRRINLGTTEIPEEIFIDFLDSIKGKYSQQK